MLWAGRGRWRGWEGQEARKEQWINEGAGGELGLVSSGVERE